MELVEPQAGSGVRTLGPNGGVDNMGAGSGACGQSPTNAGVGLEAGHKANVGPGAGSWGQGIVCRLEREEGGLKARSIWSLMSLGPIRTTAR